MRCVPPALRPSLRQTLKRWAGGVNVNLLIDAVVRQTTVLVAELATSRGLRAPRWSPLLVKY